MAQSIKISGNTWSNVPYVDFPKADNTGDARYYDVGGSQTITSNNTYDVTTLEQVVVNVPSGQPTLQTKSKTYTPTTSQQTESITADAGYDGLDEVNITVNAMPSGSARPASSISGSSATVTTGTNTLTLSKTISNTPQVTAGYVASGTAGNTSVSLTASVTTKAATTYHPSTSNQTIASGTYLTGTQTINKVTMTNLTADNIKKDVVVQIGDSSDADCVASITGTYEGGGGGDSKNTQVVQGTTRTTSSTLTAIGAEMTVSKTGTYSVYWSAFRSSTSSSYTYGTQLYVDGTAYGTQNTTWSNHVQNNHLTNVSLTVNQKIRVYGRESRGSSYYIYAPTLVIVEE